MIVVHQPSKLFSSTNNSKNGTPITTNQIVYILARCANQCADQGGQIIPPFISCMAPCSGHRAASRKHSVNLLFVAAIYLCPIIFPYLKVQSKLIPIHSWYRRKRNMEEDINSKMTGNMGSIE